MDFELLVVRGRSATEALKLIDGVTTIGRQDDCHVRIKSSSVSRKHCELFEKKGMLLVKDLGSSNGTIVNGKKIDGQQVLEPGDELTIGGIKLKVAKIGQAPPVKNVPEPAAKAAGKPAAKAVAANVDDDFDIDFNDLPESVAITDEADEVVPDDDGFEIQLDEAAETPAPAPPPKPGPSTVKAVKPATATAKKAEPPREEPANEADAAIADFLLDLKLDD